MKEIKVKMPDGSVLPYPSGKTVKEILSSWKKEVICSAVGARVNNLPVDLSYTVEDDASIEVIDITSKEGLGILRHSISHVMAQAVQDIFKDVKVTIGPSIEDGFYYDFEYADTFTPEDLEKIEKRMDEIIAEDHPFIRREVTREEAVSLFEGRGEPYKVELLNDLPADIKNVSLYGQGGFVDLCRGPHIPSTGMIKAFKLLNVAGAYWRGDERNKMLQRIYGTGFANKKDLSAYLKLIEEAKNRDHRKLGR